MRPTEPPNDGIYMFEYATDRYFLERDTKASEIAGWEPHIRWSINGGSCPMSWDELLDEFEEAWEAIDNWVSLHILDTTTFNSWPMARQQNEVFKGYHLLDCREEIIGLVIDSSLTIYFEEDMPVAESLAAAGLMIHTINENQDFWWLKEIK